MKFLKQGTPEYLAMWEALKTVTGDFDDDCPETGECWQYMGTHDGAHQFRHRHRPPTARPINEELAIDRVYLNIDVLMLKLGKWTWKRYPLPKTQPTTLYKSCFHEDYDCISDADPGL